MALTNINNVHRNFQMIALNTSINTSVLFSSNEIFSVKLQKGQTELWWKNFLIGELPEENQLKKSKEVTRDTPHLIQDSQTFIQHLTIYFFILS